MTTATAKTASFVRDARAALRGLMPTSVLNWRDARFYGRYGEIELHILDLLCMRARESVDIGANEGCYVNLMRKHSRRVIAFEPLPWLAMRLKRKFGRNVSVHQIALSDRRGTTTLRVPIVDGVTVEGCASIAETAREHYGAFRQIEVRTERLDEIYTGDAGFMKIDVEGHEEAVLEGARNTIACMRPRVLIEVVEYLAPGGVARIMEFFRELDYRGHFIYRRNLYPVQSFDPVIMQDPKNAPDLTAPLAERERFPSFVYNFMFFPAEETEDTAERIRDRICRL